MRFLAWKNTAVLAEYDDPRVRARSLPQAMDDVALLRCIARGDRTAFAELFQRLQHPLFGYLMTLALDQPAAEELLGETCMEIWRQAARFDGRIAVNVWAFSLARHRVIIRRKVDETLQKLTDSLEQAFSALGDTFRDPQFGEQTRKAASSLSDALNATFAEASERFRKK